MHQQVEACERNGKYEPLSGPRCKYVQHYKIHDSNMRFSQTIFLHTLRQFSKMESELRRALQSMDFISLNNATGLLFSSGRMAL